MARSSMLGSARKILAIVADASPLEERADAVIDELANIVAYDAAQIAQWDSRLSLYRTVASRGYSLAMREALNGTVYRNDRVWSVLEERTEPVFWDDCPFDRRDSGFYRGSIEAHGYREGATMLLRDGRGAHLGMLVLSLESDTAPDFGIRELLGVVGDAITPLVDRLAPARQFASLRSSQRSTAALDRTYGWLPVGDEGLPSQALLDRVTEVLARSDRPVRFHWHDPEPKSGRRRMRPEPLLVEVFPFEHSTCQAVLSWSRSQLPYELTRREMDVLAILATGASNAEIAGALSMSVRTVTTHVEHILTKTSASSRTTAALIAEREGLLGVDNIYVI